MKYRNLNDHIRQIAIVDSHEHLMKEPQWLSDGPADVLADLISNYVPADFISAGADPQAVERLTRNDDPDIEGRWAAVAKAWEKIRFTGYGEGVRTVARAIYDIDEFCPEQFRAAQPKLDALRQPGERLRLLRDQAKLDHIQTDDFIHACLPDESGPDFFLYDLSWRPFGCGEIEVACLARETGVTVNNLDTLRQAMEALFEKYAACAIAMKSQHAYDRTLRWVERDAGDAERSLQAVLKNPDAPDEAASLCLGDWCMDQGCLLAAEYNLPFKIHTGYLAGNHRMPIDRINSGHLCPLLTKHPDTRFVLMHIAYPYSDELIALTKHYPNVWADLCWAWSINPLASADFVRRFIHAAPLNKLFGFGGDTQWPTSALAYSLQARKWLTKALSAEVADGELTEAEAMEVATCLLRENQLACFDLPGTRQAISAKQKNP
jgi:hypothetical protein